MKRLLVAFLLLITGSVYSVPEHIQQCMDCHGPDGVSQHKDMPTIAGASSAFIEDTFAAYKYDLRGEVKSRYRYGDTSRKETSMTELAKQLTNAQVSEAAEYFAALPFRPVKQPFDAAKAKIGEAIHAERCEKCHADGGASAAEDSPILAGQWREYLEKSMDLIMNSGRDIDERMNRTVKKLSDDDWDALLNYYASQQ